MISLIEGCC